VLTAGSMDDFFVASWISQGSLDLGEMCADVCGLSRGRPSADLAQHTITAACEPVALSVTTLTLCAANMLRTHWDHLVSSSTEHCTQYTMMRSSHLNTVWYNWGKDHLNWPSCPAFS
jgi:hypothetical protein